MKKAKNHLHNYHKLKQIKSINVFFLNKSINVYLNMNVNSFNKKNKNQCININNIHVY